MGLNSGMSTYTFQAQACHGKGGEGQAQQGEMPDGQCGVDEGRGGIGAPFCSDQEALCWKRRCRPNLQPIVQQSLFGRLCLVCSCCAFVRASCRSEGEWGVVQHPVNGRDATSTHPRWKCQREFRSNGGRLQHQLQTHPNFPCFPPLLCGKSYFPFFLHILGGGVLCGAGNLLHAW